MAAGRPRCRRGGCVLDESRPAVRRSPVSSNCLPSSAPLMTIKRGTSSPRGRKGGWPGACAGRRVRQTSPYRPSGEAVKRGAPSRSQARPGNEGGCASRYRHPLRPPDSRVRSPRALLNVARSGLPRQAAEPYVEARRAMAVKPRANVLVSPGKPARLIPEAHPRGTRQVGVPLDFGVRYSNRRSTRGRSPTHNSTKGPTCPTFQRAPVCFNRRFTSCLMEPSILPLPIDWPRRNRHA